MSDLRKAAQAILDRWDLPVWESSGPVSAEELIANLRAALAQPDGPCPTCVSLARAVMMDQSGNA